MHQILLSSCGKQPITDLKRENKLSVCMDGVSEDFPPNNGQSNMYHSMKYQPIRNESEERAGNKIMNGFDLTKKTELTHVTRKRFSDYRTHKWNLFRSVTLKKPLLPRNNLTTNHIFLKIIGVKHFQTLKSMFLKKNSLVSSMTNNSTRIPQSNVNNYFQYFFFISLNYILVFNVFK